MSAANLQSPILEGGIRSIKFFNGRLLSGEDLSQEQIANREGRRRLGQASGDGVAFGLEVSERAGGSPPTSPTVTVTKGLAVNRQGQTLMLTEDTDVSLVRPASGSPAVAITFGECEPTQPGLYVAGAGVYLLTIASATGSEGRAPVSGLGNIAATCNTRYTIEGVQFRLLSLSCELTDLDLLRNRVAYKCFGVYDPKVQSFLTNPFGPRVEKYGLLDDLRPDPLTDCDVPLAVIYWTAFGIQFIDLWSVRRRITKPNADANWIPLVSDRRVSEAEAILLQFEEQIEGIRVNETGLGTIAAAQRFDFLPPLGLMPISGPGSPSGFNPLTFFGARASKDVALTDGNLLRSLWHEALFHEPIDLSNSDKIQLYLIWENVQAVQAAQVNQLTLVFASHTLSYRGVARFGYAHWDLDRFASQVI